MADRAGELAEAYVEGRSVSRDTHATLEKLYDDLRAALERAGFKELRGDASLPDPDFHLVRDSWDSLSFIRKALQIAGRAFADEEALAQEPHSADWMRLLNQREARKREAQRRTRGASGA